MPLSLKHLSPRPYLAGLTLGWRRTRFVVRTVFFPLELGFKGGHAIGRRYFKAPRSGGMVGLGLAAAAYAAAIAGVVKEAPRVRVITLADQMTGPFNLSTREVCRPAQCERNVKDFRRMARLWAGVSEKELGRELGDKALWELYAVLLSGIESDAGRNTHTKHSSYYGAAQFSEDTFGEMVPALLQLVKKPGVKDQIDELKKYRLADINDDVLMRHWKEPGLQMLAGLERGYFYFKKMRAAGDADITAQKLLGAVYGTHNLPGLIFKVEAHKLPRCPLPLEKLAPSRWKIYYRKNQEIYKNGKVPPAVVMGNIQSLQWGYATAYMPAEAAAKGLKKPAPITFTRFTDLRELQKACGLKPGIFGFGLSIGRLSF